MVTAIPAIRLCLGTLMMVCSVALLLFAAPAEAIKCTKKGTNGDDVLRGTRKADVLCGRGGNDVLLGKRGKDRLLGADGNDTLQGGSGSDKLKGQGGIDTASYEDSAAAVTVNLANGAASGEGEDTIAGVENVTGSPLVDLLTGNTADNVLTGGEGDDKLAGDSGADTLAGEGGTDTANYFGAGNAVSVDLSIDSASGQGADSLPGIENVIGSPQDDTLAGDSADNTLHGGAGTDSVSYATAATGVTVDLATDAATGAGADSVPAIENLTGSPQADTLSGDSGANALDGGGGGDTVSYAGSTSAVTVDLVNGTATGHGSDTLTSLEKAIGSDLDDALLGNDAANVLTGGEGNDLLAAGTGEDQLLGEDGNDQIYGESQNDVLDGGVGDDLLDGGTGVDACDGGPGTNQFAGGCDTAPPQLDGLSITPAQINTSLSGQNVTFTLNLSDPVTGVDPAASEVAIAAPNDGPGDDPRGSAPLQLVSGDENDGTYEATISVPRLAPTGTWRVSLSLADVSGNVATWSSSELIAASLPGTFDQTGAGDSIAPQLLDLSISPTTIDTSGSDQDVTFSLDVTDNLAGVDLGASHVEIASPDGQPRGSDALQLVSGNSTNGTFQATVTVPRLAPQGTWTVSLSLADAAGNEVSWSSPQLIADGQPGTFEQTGLGDANAPVLADFSLTPSQVDTTLGGQVVTFDLDATDDLSGIDPAASEVEIFSPDGQPLTSNGLQLVSGTATNGTYQATITIPQGSSPGTWTVSVNLLDEAANQTSWSSAQLIAAGFPGTFTNVGSDPS